MADGPADALRVDKWLWHARFFKTRSLAATVVSGGHVRLNGNRISKPAQAVRPGDVLTVPMGEHVRVIRVETLSVRRGPASEAQQLYQDLSPLTEPDRQGNGGDAPKAAKGKPSREDRRIGRLSRQGRLE